MSYDQTCQYALTIIIIITILTVLLLELKPFNHSHEDVESQVPSQRPHPNIIGNDAK